MANAKNTIQNIPLTGLLNLNTLKTDVKQFQGFNEKNSTVFGGELGPLYVSQSEYAYLDQPGYKYMEDKNNRILQIPESEVALIKLNLDDSIKGAYICTRDYAIIEFIVTQAALKYRCFENTEHIEDIYEAYKKLQLEEYTTISTSIVSDLEEVYFAEKDNATNRILIAEVGLSGQVKVFTVDFSDILHPNIVDDSSYTFTEGKNITVKVYKGYPYSGNYNNAGLGINSLLVNNQEQYFFQIIANSGISSSEDLHNKSESDLPYIKDFILDSDTWTIVVTARSFPSTNGNTGTIYYPVVRQVGNRLVTGEYHEDVIFTYNTSKSTKKRIFENYIMPLRPINVNISSAAEGAVTTTTEDFFGLKSRRSNNDTFPERDMSLELYQYTGRGLYAAPKIDASRIIERGSSFEDSFAIHFGDCFNKRTSGGMLGFILTGHLNGLLSSPMRYTFNGYESWSDSDNSIFNDFEIYYANGGVFSIVAQNGWPICEPGTILGRNLSPCKQLNQETPARSIAGYITFKTTNGWVFYYSNELGKFNKNKPIVVGDNYLIEVYKTVDLSLRDQEDPICTNIGYIGTSIPAVYSYGYTSRAKYIDSGTLYKIPIPCCDYGKTSELTGAIYGSGFNVLYNLSNIKFTGYAPNPYVLSNFPDYNKWRKNTVLDIGSLDMPYDWSKFAAFSSKGFDPYYIQRFFSYGDQVRTATYYGEYDIFQNINYPIDTNGNAILPISIDSAIINGYMNNSMVTNKISGNSYPLIYYNNNRYVYAYFFLSMLSNVEGVFVIQSQHYAFDANNIYSIQYQNGLLASSDTIAYKKNMTYLGSLPNKALFYSKFNKTLYAFMGDSSLYKLIEASDINEIYSVNQNPSTLSLWICADSGIYVISDTDMFKLDIITNLGKIYFHEDHFDAFVSRYRSEFRDNYVYQDSYYLYNIDGNKDVIPLSLKTCFYGLGNEQKATYDCWYLRMHSADKKPGYIDIKSSTITDISVETETKHYDIGRNDYDENGIAYIKYQPKNQPAVATQLELKSNIALYQLSLGANIVDATAQMSHHNI
jgi:hypothetical protein